MNDPILVERSWSSLVEMTGEDRTRFLNAYVTCDVKPLEPGQGTYGFVTQAKGRILADLRVLALADRLWLELPAGKAEEIAEHLRKYVIVDRVEIASFAGRTLLSLAGSKADDVLGVDVPEPTWGHAEVEIDGIAAVVLREPDLSVPVRTLWVAAEDATELRQRLVDRGAAEAGQEDWDQLRVEAGYPRFGRDYDAENFPQETGLEDAVSYTKGCYLGQEVVARIHYRGGVNKLLRGLVFDGEGAAEGAGVVHDGREAGKVTSSVRSPAHGAIGLAVLHKRVEAGARVEIDGGGSAEVVGLPFEIR